MPERRILETTQLLGALPPDTLETLRQQSTIRTVARNEVLFRQGDAAGELFGIVNGRIAILSSSPDGRERRARRPSWVRSEICPAPHQSGGGSSG